MTRARTILFSAGILVVLMLSACGNGPPPGQASCSGGESGGGGGAAVQAVQSGPDVTTVKETDELKFSPSAASVKVGDIVQ